MLYWFILNLFHWTMLQHLTRRRWETSPPPPWTSPQSSSRACPTKPRISSGSAFTELLRKCITIYLFIIRLFFHGLKVFIHFTQYFHSKLISRNFLKQLRNMVFRIWDFPKNFVSRFKNQTNKNFGHDNDILISYSDLIYSTTNNVLQYEYCSFKNIEISL